MSKWCFSFIIKIGYKKIIKRVIYKPMHLLMLHERERCLKPCPAHVPEHDPCKLLYCIYVRLQPQINLLSCLRNVPLKKKVQLPSRFVSFWMVVNLQSTQIRGDLKLNHTPECACILDFHRRFDQVVFSEESRRCMKHSMSTRLEINLFTCICYYIKQLRHAAQRVSVFNFS